MRSRVRTEDRKRRERKKKRTERQRERGKREGGRGTQCRRTVIRQRALKGRRQRKTDRDQGRQVDRESKDPVGFEGYIEGGGEGTCIWM